MELNWADGFNPRTRDGCDPVTYSVYIDHKVSIHAPVMGATRVRTFAISNAEVSIHAPVMGATDLYCQRL